eukprot:CAMPEP_0174383778 /NCGR_PEP_ID=MMETSP0811_2-20130205/125481_1 /TAXON_ID=73025 ORGANISM="Eutreptiella gymnastica-like, Strain CCMP1594" /NCGR_SAMPLE_ID=MMETSP0811_2 /ASSEMBLY_ACC=CAM_ASM_000667 /LENGTH=207 /DNA_ID=CAMNT_0015537517 /DNA_START=663 /DNA_END=1287 /DNA_ORIENTATION=+
MVMGGEWAQKRWPARQQSRLDCWHSPDTTVHVCGPCAAPVAAGWGGVGGRVLVCFCAQWMSMCLVCRAPEVGLSSPATRASGAVHVECNQHFIGNRKRHTGGQQPQRHGVRSFTEPGRSSLATPGLRRKCWTEPDWPQVTRLGSAPGLRTTGHGGHCRARGCYRGLLVRKGVEQSFALGTLGRHSQFQGPVAPGPADGETDLSAYNT